MDRLFWVSYWLCLGLLFAVLAACGGGGGGGSGGVDGTVLFPGKCTYSAWVKHD